MDIDERIAALTMNLELMSRDREDDNKRLYEQGRQIQALFLRAEKDGEFIGKFIKEMSESVKELTESVKEDRGYIRALAESVKEDRGFIRALAESRTKDGEFIRELAGSVKELAENVKKDSENIRALARIAEIHERRLTGMEGTRAE